jgi:hypothetical protein
MGRIAEFLLTVSGANRDVLAEAPKERTKQIAMGAVLVSTAAIAAVSASYAFHIALHLWWPVAVLFGLAWGLVILNLDRWLVVSTPRLKTKLGTLGMALPRVLLAVLIGAVISTPLTLAVFSAEINVEVKKMAATADSDFNQQMEQDERYKQIPTWEEQIKGLQADIRTPVSDADVNNNDAVKALEGQLTQTSLALSDADKAVTDESAGTGGTGVPGHGDAYWDKVAVRDRLRVEVQQLTQQLTGLKQEVRQQLDAAEPAKNAQQQKQVDDLQAQVDDAKHDRADAIAAHEQAVKNQDGILARLTALEHIQKGDSMLAAAHLLLFLFMTALECLPIIFKTMLALAPANLYERLMALEEERAEARVRLRMQTEYEEAETMARSALAAAEARAARTLEAESKATGLVLGAQLAVTREGVRRWREEQIERMPGSAANVVVPDLEELFDDLDSVHRLSDQPA